MVPDEQNTLAEHSSKPAAPSKALSVLAAVSAGGLMAVRMKPGPLLFLAGVAAAALVSRKRIIRPTRPLELLPERPPEPAPQPLPEVDAWLTRQIEREQQAPVITLDVVEAPQESIPAPEPLETARRALHAISIPPEERLESSISGPVEAEKTVVATPHSFFDVSWLPDPPKVEVPTETNELGFIVPPLEEPVKPFLDFESDEPVRALNASWLLGIEPLPSWDERSADPASSPPPASSDARFLDEAPGPSSFTSQPVPECSPSPPAPAQPVFVPALFQGAELPDEITMAELPVLPEATPSDGPQEPVLDQVMTSLFVPAPPPEVEEVPVTLAKLGEATFDDPLAALEESPTQVPRGTPPPPPLRPLAPVVEAEIVVRPRGFSQTKVQAKNASDNVEGLPAPEPFADSPLVPDAPPDPQAPTPFSGSLPPAPVVLPREQKARKTWRSWWRGD